MKKDKLLQLLVAFACALSLWIYVVTVVAPENDMTISGIPVTFVGEESLRSNYGLMLTGVQPETVSVKFHGSRSDLKQLLNNRGEISASIDVSKFTSVRDYSASYSIVLPASVQNRAISLTDQSPKTVKFTVSEIATQAVEVKGVYLGTVADGYAVGDPIFDADSIVVSGLSEVVDRVEYAQVVLDGEKIAADLTGEMAFTLVDADGQAIESKDLSANIETIGVRLPVYPIRTLPLRVNVLAGGGASSEDVEVEVTPETVRIYGESSLFDDLTAITAADVDLSLLYEDRTYTQKLVLPHGIFAAVPNQTVTVSVHFKEGLLTETYRVGKPIYENLAPGIDVVEPTHSYSVTLRGAEEAMGEVDPDQLMIYADLSGISQAGTYEVPMRVVGVPVGVGVVGTMLIDVEVVAHSAA